VVFLRRKQKQKKQESDHEKAPKPKKSGSAVEQAYLDQLQRSIATPGRTPYIDRRQQKADRQKQMNVTDPLYDSGPQAGDETETKHSRVEIDTEDGHVSRGTDGVYSVNIDVPTADLDLDEQERQTPPTPPQEQKPPQAEQRVHEMPPPKPREAAPEPPPEPETREPEGLYARGTLVLWDNDKLAIYDEHQEEKGYDLLYVIEPGGRLQPKGVCLFAYDPQAVGLLSTGIYEWMTKSMQWDKDALMAHLEDPSVAEKVPILEGAGAAAAASGQANGRNNGKFVRGQTFSIRMGSNQWTGVYWGRDQLGTVVAHNTNRVWNLMHLDLKRFDQSLELGDVLSSERVNEIEQALSENAES
jgi:hypothetical protein